MRRPHGPYAMLDVDLAQRLPAVALTGRQRGLAILMRVDGRPAAFHMQAFPPGSSLGPDDLWALVEDTAAPALTAARIREELSPATSPAPLEITVAVCTRDRVDLLADCLESLASVRAGRPDLDVLVVDNNPPDDATQRLVARCEGVRYAVEPLQGLDFARNRAIDEARGRWIAFVDDDAVVDAGWLAGLEQAVEENPDAGAVTGLVLPRELETDAQVLFEARGGFRRGFAKLRWHGDRELHNPLFPYGAGIFGAGANMAIRADVLRALGGFDEALDTGAPLPGGGDLDMFVRVLDAGHPLVYEPAMLVFHRHRPDAAALRRQYRSWGEGMFAHLAKVYGTDPAARGRIRQLALWWAAYQARAVRDTALRRAPGSPALPLSELVGGIAGASGGYARSRRRIERMKAGHG